MIMLSRRRNYIRAKIEALLQESNVTERRVPVERIAERYGIDIRREAIDDEAISGFIARQSGRNAIIGVNNIHSSTRQRFTIAHELGHFFLHGDQGQQEVHIDRTQQFQVKLRGPASSQGVDNEEMEANLFAAELLMPARFLVRDFQGFDPTDEDDETVADLAEKYGVSEQAMSIRLAYLGLLNQE
jgi:Zn-dependent peptidase ImmA (M78 family)